MMEYINLRNHYKKKNLELRLQNTSNQKESNKMQRLSNKQVQDLDQKHLKLPFEVSM